MAMPCAIRKNEWAACYIGAEKRKGPVKKRQKFSKGFDVRRNNIE